MILKINLPEKCQTLIKLVKEEKIYYALPIDINESGNFQHDVYVVVTTFRILVLNTHEIQKEYSIKDCDRVFSEVRIGCGMLIIERDGEEKLIGRFSSKGLAKFSNVSRGCMLLKQGSMEAAVSDENEKSCHICGRALPGTKECPFCAKKGEGVWHEIRILASPYKGKLFTIFLTMLAASAVTLLNPEVQKHLIDNVLTKPDVKMNEAVIYLAAIFLLGIGIFIINVVKSNLSARLGSIMSMDMRAKLYKKVQVLSLSFIDERKPGELMNRIVNDTTKIKDFMSDVFCNLFTVCLIFVCDMIYMMVLDIKLAMLAFICVPVSAFLAIAVRKNLHRRFHMQMKKGDQIHSNLQDVLSGMNVVKTYGKEEEESRHFNKTADDYARVQSGNEVFWAVFFPIMQFVIGAGVFLIAYFGGKDVLFGEKSLGELVQFTTYTSLLYMYLNWITNMPRVLINMVTSVERISDILKSEPTIYEKNDAIFHEVDGDFEFCDASFGYKSYQPILEHVNIKIHKGEMIGLVGASGTGKSTLINLIMHLYEVNDGKLLVDGIDIKNLKIDKYHSQIGVVLQETFLFSGTILNNIKFAKPDATYEEVIMAAKMANAHDFICRTPDGYNTYVGEHGYSLSGGERQRIAIARAILNKPRLLILDEATASLDTESEYLIQQALSRLTKGRTTFAIAHRLSTLKNADRLVVIDGHNIAEVGTHEELMAKKGIYYGLVIAQLEMSAKTSA